MNDSLDVIEQCWRYAERWNRLLLVDMRHSAFCRSMSAVFVAKDARSVNFSHHFRKFSKFDLMTIRPTFLRGRVNRYGIQIALHSEISQLEWRLPVEARTGSPVDFDSSRDHRQRVLVRESYRTGMNALAFFRRVRLQEDIRDEVRHRLRPCVEAPYVGLHVRHSDLKSDYITFFHALRDRLTGERVLICSDNKGVQRAAVTVFDRSTVFCVSDIPDLHGRPYQLPFLPSDADERELIINSLTDLFALAMADRFYSSDIVNRVDKVSGYSQLARDLRNNPEILASLGVSRGSIDG